MYGSDRYPQVATRGRLAPLFSRYRLVTSALRLAVAGRLWATFVTDFQPVRWSAFDAATAGAADTAGRIKGPPLGGPHA